MITVLFTSILKAIQQYNNSETIKLFNVIVDLDDTSIADIGDHSSNKVINERIKNC